MDPDSLRRIGRLGKPWGHRGELTLHLDRLDPDEFAREGSLFVDIDGQMVPFRISHIQDKGRDLLIKFEELDDPQAAAILVGCDLYAPPGMLADGSDESWDPDDLIGLIVSDEAHGELGEVTGMAGTDLNPVMVVLSGEHEILIPIADEIILDVNAEEGTMKVRTPPGLVDLYRPK